MVVARRHARIAAACAAVVTTGGCGTAPSFRAAHPPAAGSGPPSWVTTPTLRDCPVASPAARTQLPAVTLRCLGSARTLSLDRLPRRPTIVNLWASWCVQCQREAPRLAAAAASVGHRVAFVGVDTEDERDSALDYLHYFRLTYPQLADPNADVLHRLAAPGLPVTVAVDAAGRVVYRRIGEISAAQLSAALRAADPRLAPTAADPAAKR